MPWGGVTENYQNKQKLINTCSFDNILFAVYMIVTFRSDIHKELEKLNDQHIQVILEIMNDMKRHNWNEAKRKFLTDVRQLNPNSRRRLLWI